MGCTDAVQENGGQAPWPIQQQFWKLAWHGMGAVFARGRSFWQSRQHLGPRHPPNLVPIHQRADWQSQSPLPITLHAMRHAEPPFSPLSDCTAQGN